MAQQTKYIDLSRSYLPIDPNTLPQTMHGTEREDTPEQRMPVVPYEGWNFMPTAYGWRSYFGLTGTLNINALANPDKTRHVFVFQRSDLTNLLVALCDDGIYVKQGESTGTWTHDVELTDPDDGSVREWSWCIIENVLYVYRQGEDHVWSMASSASTFTENTPTTLNMAGQLGIFKAGGRLGYWDSDNSIGHSAYDDKFNVTPSIATGANITTLIDLIGKIVTIVGHGDGFIVYGTKSIIGVQKDLNNTFGWRAKAISTQAGIAYREQVAIGHPDSVHFSWTAIGLLKIENFNAEVVSPELYDYVKESQDPVYLKFLEGRYLFVCLANEDYVEGAISFYTHTIPGETIDLDDALTEYESIPTEGEVADEDTAQGYLDAIDAGMPVIYPENHDLGDNVTPIYSDVFELPFNPSSLLANVLAATPDASDLSFSSEVGFHHFDGTDYNIKPNNMLAGYWITMKTGARDLGGGVGFGTSIEIESGNYLENVDISALDALFEGMDNVTVVDASTFEIDNNNNFFAKVSAFYNHYRAYAEAYVEEVKSQLSLDEDDDSVETITESDSHPVIPASISGGQLVLGTIFSKLPQSVDSEHLGPFTIANSGSSMAFSVITDFSLEYGVYEDAIPYVIARPKTSVGLSRSTSSGDVNYSTIASPQVKFNVISTTGVTYTAPAAAINFTGGTTTACLLTLGIQTALIAEYGAGAFTNQDVSVSEAKTQVEYKNYNGIQVIDIDDTNLRSTTEWYSQFTLSGIWTRTSDNEDFSFSVTLEAYSDQYTCVDTLSTFILESDLQSTTNPCDDTAQSYLCYSYPSSYINSVTGETVATPEDAVTLDDPDILRDLGLCALEATEENDRPGLNGLSIPASDTGYAPPNDIDFDTDIVAPGSITLPGGSFTYPPVTFLMQTGSPTPYDILFEGAYVYDTHLKRWGKMKNQFRTLIDFSPINSTSLGVIDYTVFGMQGALLNNSGAIKLFDTNPTDSYLKFGKIGGYRQGFTALEEVRADFRRACDGTLEIETSIDGRSVEAGLTKEYAYSDEVQLSQGIGSSGRWHNIGFKGQFDLSYLEFRSWTQSRR